MNGEQFEESVLNLRICSKTRGKMSSRKNVILRNPCST